MAQYHLSPESKFLNAEYIDMGPTKRRHVQAIAIEHIGKEADRWEEQFFLGLDEDAQVKYGVAPPEFSALRERLRQVVAKVGHRQFAQRAGISRQTTSGVISGKSIFISRKVAAKLAKAVATAEPQNGTEVAAAASNRIRRHDP